MERTNIKVCCRCISGLDFVCLLDDVVIEVVKAPIWIVQQEVPDIVYAEIAWLRTTQQDLPLSFAAYFEVRKHESLVHWSGHINARHLDSLAYLVSLDIVVVDLIQRLHLRNSETTCFGLVRHI